MSRLGKRLAALPTLGLVAVVTMGAGESGCGQTSDQVQRVQQERILQEGTSQIGMPAIKNFREKKMLKEILELRDQATFVTYTYTFSEMTGEFRPFCRSIGYPLPYATQFTNPQKEISGHQSLTTIAQADPNGLFSPASAEGTWVMCKDPTSDKVGVVYTEPKVTAFPWRLDDRKFLGEK